MKQRASREALRGELRDRVGHPRIGELRQSLSLIVASAVTASTFLGFGLLTAHLSG
jgi:hypothetical protein